MSSVQHIDLKMMNSSLPIRGGSIPHAVSQSPNASIATGVGSTTQIGPAQDRLIVGVDFGTTYSGG
jgi:hypothetical protein